MIEDRLPQLIEGCVKNNRQSQKLLYQEFYDFAMAICLRYAGNSYEASEVLNEGFFKAFRHIDKYDKKLPFKAWLGKIMHNTSIDYYRANLKTAFMEDLEKADHMGIEASVEQKLAYEELLRMVQNLPPAYRVIFNLNVIDGYSHEEIAGLLHISSSTSRSNLYKARQKLQQMLRVLTHPGNRTRFDTLNTISINQPVIDKDIDKKFRQ